MGINIGPPEVDELRPRIAVIGVGGVGGNAIANMIDNNRLRYQYYYYYYYAYSDYYLYDYDNS